MQQVLKPSIEDAAKIIAAAYRRRLLNVRYTKPGNTGVRAFEAVGSKTRVFADGTGVWSVIGAQTKGGQMRAPQMRFGETGTVQRFTKTGQNRGIMPALHWLQNSMLESNDAARKALIDGIAKRVARIRSG